VAGRAGELEEPQGEQMLDTRTHALSLSISKGGGWRCGKEQGQHGHDTMPRWVTAKTALACRRCSGLRL